MAQPVAVLPCNYGGMGALVHDREVGFRVWAPGVEGVEVALWPAPPAGALPGAAVPPAVPAQAQRYPLAREGTEYWSCNVPGARPGDRYKFVLRVDGRELWRIDPSAREVTGPGGEGVIPQRSFPWHHPDFHLRPPQELVMYAIHVATFNPGGNGGAGGFASVVERLDDLHDLGINCIDLMPSLEFADNFSWGFDPSNIFSISTAHGGPAALKRLVDEAHARDIGVIFDVVYNHFGAGPLDLWQFNGSGENGKGGMYFYADARSQTPWGDTRPNYGRSAVRNFLIDNARMWLREYRMDGLRWDATSFIRNIYGNNADPAHDIPDGWALMQHVTQETDVQAPWKLHIAEDLRNNDWIVRDSGTGGAGFDAQWDSEFVNPVRTAIVSPYDGGRDMCAVQHAIEHRYADDPFKRVIYTESHDEIAAGRKRVPEAICPGDAGCLFSRKRSTLGAVLVFTSPGIPMLFQGQEVLENRWGKKGDPVDWDRAATQSRIRQLYRDLIELRRNDLAETAGLLGPHARVYHLNDDDNVIAFHRWRTGGPRDDVVVVVNFGNRAYAEYTIGFPCPGEWRVRFNSDSRLYGADFDNHPSDTVHAYGPPHDGMESSGRVGIGMYTAVILSQSA